MNRSLSRRGGGLPSPAPMGDTSRVNSLNHFGQQPNPHVECLSLWFSVECVVIHSSNSLHAVSKAGINHMRWDTGTSGASRVASSDRLRPRPWPSPSFIQALLRLAPTAEAGLAATKDKRPCINAFRPFWQEQFDR